MSTLNQFVCYLNLKQNKMMYRESIIITSVRLWNSTEGARFTVCDSESWPRRGIEQDSTRIHNAELLFISDIYKKKKRRWLTSSLKIYIPYLNSDCTIKYIIEKRAKCKLRKIQSNFIWIFLNVVDTDETLCCDAQKISRALHIVQVKKSVSLCAFIIENSVCVAQQHFQYSLVIVKD